MPENEDAGSIMLHDTRTRRHSGDEHERQFLVGEDEDEDDGGADGHLGRPKSLEEDVQSFSSNASMDDLSRPSSRQAARAGVSRLGGLLDNAAARTSHLDVHSLALAQDDEATLHGDDDDDDDGKRRPGLAAKAGIISVSLLSICGLGERPD